MWFVQRDRLLLCWGLNGFVSNWLMSASLNVNAGIFQPADRKWKVKKKVVGVRRDPLQNVVKYSKTSTMGQIPPINVWVGLPPGGYHADGSQLCSCSVLDPFQEIAVCNNQSDAKMMGKQRPGWSIPTWSSKDGLGMKKASVFLSCEEHITWTPELLGVLASDLQWEVRCQAWG